MLIKVVQKAIGLKGVVDKKENRVNKMSNMSYCRFQNTLSDLLDCLDHIIDDELSEDEERARKNF